MPRYEYACEPCDTHFDVELPMSRSGDPTPCPFCGEPAARVITAPRFLFKADPLDNRPIWHNHGTFGHAHPRGRGFHGRGEEKSNGQE
jgi:putative FmdB family regulatory protein